MCIFAYEDKKRTKKISANEASELNRVKYYFCLNPDCDAELKVTSVDGEQKTHFRGGFKTGIRKEHVDNCWGKNSGGGFFNRLVIKIGIVIIFY